MTNSKLIIATVAMAITYSDAFTVSSLGRSATTQMQVATGHSAHDFYFIDDVDTRNTQSSIQMEQPLPQQKQQQQQQPTSATTQKKTAATKPKAKNPAHKEGVFSPVVQIAKTALGDEELNKLRGKVISMHSDVIKGFVDTAESPVGQSVLKTLFTVADVDRSGTIEESELEQAFRVMGFTFLKEKQVKGIFARADLNHDGHIDLEEFMREAPVTLRTNLVKLAKKNGGDMGLLV